MSKRKFKVGDIVVVEKKIIRKLELDELIRIPAMDAQITRSFRHATPAEIFENMLDDALHGKEDK